MWVINRISQIFLCSDFYVDRPTVMLTFLTVLDGARVGISNYIGLVCESCAWPWIDLLVFKDLRMIKSLHARLSHTQVYESRHLQSRLPDSHIAPTPHTPLNPYTHAHLSTTTTVIYTSICLSSITHSLSTPALKTMTTAFIQVHSIFKIILLWLVLLWSFVCPQIPCTNSDSLCLTNIIHRPYLRSLKCIILNFEIFIFTGR